MISYNIDVVLVLILFIYFNMRMTMRFLSFLLGFFIELGCGIEKKNTVNKYMVYGILIYKI